MLSHVRIRWSWRLIVWLFVAVLVAAALCAWLVLQDVRRRFDASIIDFSLPEEIEPLVPLHTKLRTPQPGDWLEGHFELGQTYAEYVGGWPQKADKDRGVIYVQPVGDFSVQQRRIVNITADFLGVYFDVPVRLCDDVPLDNVPEAARRLRSDGRTEQILTQWVGRDILTPRLPGDAFLNLGITPSDIWPGGSWNFVFGQAWPSARTALCSLSRYGDPDEGEAAFRLCLLRTLKNAAHETGHNMLILHCTHYECVMCGSNNLAEADRRPLEPCPHCLAKLSHATGADPARRFEKIIEFYKAHGLTAEREFCEKSLALLRR